MTFLSEFELLHVDEFIDELLHSERVCDIILPRLQVREKGLTAESPVSPIRQVGRHTHTQTHRKYQSPWVSGVILVRSHHVYEKDRGLGIRGKQSI